MRFFFLLLAILPAHGAFGHLRAVTIDPAKVGTSDLTNFPVLVSGTYSYLATVANGGLVQNASGYDIGFYTHADCATGKMAWEKEVWTAATGVVSYWVKVASVSHTVNTIFYLCYGDSGVTTDQSNETAVWDAYHRAVFHMGNGSTLSTADSTSYARTSSANSGTVTAGKVDGGIAYSGTAQTTTYPSSSSLDLASGIFTIEFWVDLTSIGASGTVFVERGVDATSGYFVSVQADGTLQLTTSNPTVSIQSSAQYTVTTGSWQHYVITNSGTAVTMYKNGAPIASSGDAVIHPAASGVALHIGSYLDSLYYVAGKMDEIRISATARSADWILATYNNQSSPGTFYSISSEAGQSARRRILY